MDSMIYTLFVSISIPILLMALLVEKKSRLPITFILVGIFISVFVSEVNGLLNKILSMDQYNVTVIITPVTEELFKIIPILYYAIVISDSKEKLFTASMATGIGFAVLENAFYLLNSPNFSMLSAVIRAFGTGLMHGMCTLLVGVGISFVKKRRKLFAVGTFGLLSTAIVYHGIYNILLQSKYSTVGALLPIVTYLPFLIWRWVIKKKSAKSDKKA
ncbi:MAG: PrsW family intramembrane metalloprotease [Clostridia bacterium]|jgi:RsiW-degrading membrane proteinase PrsW (M82 family)|nr:PrsW family intramembrane metalloprotease [Clostridia bacterium]